MDTISRSLLTFLLNSLWQIPLAAAVAALAGRFMRNGPAGHRHAVWVAALAAAILLPLASVRQSEAALTPSFDASLVAQNIAAARPAPHTPAQAAPAPPAAFSPTISVAATTATILLGAYFLFVLFRLARLAWASFRTIQIRQAAHAAPIPEQLERVWNRCQEAYGLTGVELLFSSRISGPVAAGRTIILPESLLAEPSEDVLTTAIGHEMAHVVRRDFGCNLLYELLHLPVSFHPGAWLIRSGIERTREMACDELVTQRLIDAGVYARSIMSIAGGMTALPRPGYTLGVFDGDILEERIRRLVERPTANLRRARLLLVTGLSALAICAVAASSLALTARAQGGAQAFMKQGEAAASRGNYAGAVQQFANAVAMEPANLKARLSLGNALLRQYTPGSDPNSPLVTGAQEQFREVLARDPSNIEAIDGMLGLLVNTKRFAEAHDWALKAIQADATDKFAYYTAGFLDWSMAYPDYAAARQAAGMQPQDPGIIPDASLRLKLRTGHGAQIEDGFRMLQTALQLDPDYSDAMAYMNLLYRIQAGIVDSDAQSADLIAQADSWVSKALAAKRKQAQNPQQTAPSHMQMAPPPPPPPPPPGDAQAMALPPGAIRIEASAQQAKLVSAPHPVYPPTARQAQVSGTVRLSVLIGKDGAVQHIEVMSGHPLLVPAALDSVRQWVYQQTLLNGQPVQVATTVDVNFQLGQ